MSTSRIVPPPQAVMTPTIIACGYPKSRATALLAASTANTLRPTASSTTIVLPNRLSRPLTANASRAPPAAVIR
jgi:hypothetical protein